MMIDKYKEKIVCTVLEKTPRNSFFSKLNIHYDCLGHISEHPHITWDIIQKNLDKPWNWWSLSCNPNITWKIIEQNLEKPWNWSRLCRNPNITWKIVEQNPEKPWNWSSLSRNSNFLCSEEDILEYYIKYKAASRIQKVFRESNYNPAYLLCRKRLFREFEEMVNS